MMMPPALGRCRLDLPCQLAAVLRLLALLPLPLRCAREERHTLALEGQSAQASPSAQAGAQSFEAKKTKSTAPPAGGGGAARGAGLPGASAGAAGQHALRASAAGDRQSRPRAGSHSGGDGALSEPSNIVAACHKLAALAVCINANWFATYSRQLALLYTGVCWALQRAALVPADPDAALGLHAVGATGTVSHDRGGNALLS